MGITYDIEKDTFFQRGVEKGRKQGKLEGIKEGKVHMVLGLLNSGKMTVQEIANLADMSVGEVQKIAKG